MLEPCWYTLVPGLLDVSVTPRSRVAPAQSQILEFSPHLEQTGSQSLALPSCTGCASSHRQGGPLSQCVSGRVSASAVSAGGKVCLGPPGWVLGPRSGLQQRLQVVELRDLWMLIDKGKWEVILQHVEAEGLLLVFNENKEPLLCWFHVLLQGRLLLFRFFFQFFCSFKKIK